MADEVFHPYCAWSDRGATKQFCTELTVVPARNLQGCCKINCTSPLRICRSCILQSGLKEIVTSSDTGLCEFHTTNGAHVRRAQPKLHEMPERYLRVRVGAGFNAMPIHYSGSPAFPNIWSRRVILSNVSENEHEVPEPERTLVRGKHKCTGSVLESYRRVMRLWTQGYKTHRRIAKELGFTVNYVFRLYKLRSLTPEVLTMINQSPVRGKLLSFSHALVIAQLPADLQYQYTLRALERSLSVAGLRKEAAKYL